MCTSPRTAKACLYKTGEEGALRAREAADEPRCRDAGAVAGAGQQGLGRVLEAGKGEGETFLPAVGERVIYTADVSITFEPYRQALLSTAQRTDFLSPQSSPSHHTEPRKPSKAHSAIKDTYATLNGE